MSDNEMQKIQGWFKHLNEKMVAFEKRLDGKVEGLREDMNFKFERVYREFDKVHQKFENVEGKISKFSDRFDNHLESEQTDIKLLKRQMLKIEDEIDELKERL